MKKILLSIAITFLCIFSLNSIVFAADRYAVANGNWSSPSTWSATPTGSGGASVPTSGDQVFIFGSRTVTVDIISAACSELRLNYDGTNNSTSILQFNSNMHLTVGGIFYLAGSGNRGGSLNLGTGGKLTVGALVVGQDKNATWTPGTGTVELTATNTLPATNFTSFYNLTIKGNTTTLGRHVTINNNLSVTGGILNLSAFTANRATPGGEIRIADGAILQIGGTNSFPTGYTSNTLVAGSTVEYNGADQTVSSIPQYSNLKISGSGTKSTNGAVTVGNNLEVTSTLSVRGFGFAVSGTTTNSGTINITSATGAKTFTGDVITSGNWNNSGNAPITFGGSLTSSGTFAAGSGVYSFVGSANTINGTLSIPNVNVTGSYTNNGTLSVPNSLVGTNGTLTQGNTAILNIGGTNSVSTLVASVGTNTVNYNGAAQTVKPTAYRNLTLSGSGVKDLTSVISVLGNLTVGGTATATTAADLQIGGNLTVGAGSSFAVGLNHAIAVAGTTSVSGTLTVNDGTNKGFNGSVTINSGGTWNENGNPAITFGGSVTNNGTFNASPELHVFTGAAGTIGGENPINLARAGFSGTYTNTGSLNVSTNLTGVGTLTQASGAMLRIGGLSDLRTLNATANPNTVEYNGTGAQVIVNNLNEGVVTGFYNLTINNAFGVELNQDVTVGGTLTLQNGLFTVRTGKTLTLNGANAVAVNTAFSDSRHIVTAVSETSGAKGIVRVNAVPTTGYFFPIGNGTYYLPATVNPSTASDLGLVVFDGITRNAQPNGEAVAAELKRRVLDAVWDVTNFSNNGATATVEFAWPETNNLEGEDFEDFTDNELGVSQFNPSNGQFNNFAGENDGDDESATRSGVTLFTSQFIVGERGANSPLPVRFAHVKATRKGAGVDVSFANLTEEEVAVYHVERSTNGYQFQSIGTIAPKANNNSRVDYLFNDAAPAAGDNYYRIRAVETTGKQVYSSVVKLGVTGAAASLVLYPNPATKASGINLQLANLPAGVYSIRLYNGNGQVMATKQLQHTGGSLSEALPLQGAGAGRYIVEVKGAVQFTQSFLLQ